MVPPVIYGDRRGVEGGRKAVPLFCVRDDVGRDDMESGSGVSQLIRAAVEIFGGGVMGPSSTRKKSGLA